MRKIINGKQYDTITARKIATSEDGALYEKKTGEYFIHLKDNLIGLDMIHPVTAEQAIKWAEEVAEDFAPFG